jgi:hypothetical protein
LERAIDCCFCNWNGFSDKLPKLMEILEPNRNAHLPKNLW